MLRSKAPSWPAWLHLEGAFGSWKEAVRVVGEYGNRYRITPATARVRLPRSGRVRRWLPVGCTTLVPKHAVTQRRYVRKGEVSTP